MRSRSLRLILLSCCVPAFLVAALSAQQPGSASGQQQQPQQQQPPTFRAGVQLVRVDVTVTGRDNEPVAGLQADDFEVTEDGRPQRIEQLQFVQLDGNAPVGDERSLEIRTQEQVEAEAAREDVRLLAIFLDDYHVDKSPAVMMPLRRAMTAFVNRLWPTDLVAVMDPLTPLSALRFTRSRSDLIDTINKFEGRQGEVFPIRSAMEEAQLGRPDIGRVRAEVTLSALASLAIRLGGMREGRKIVIFVSQGPATYWGTDGHLQDRMREISEAASRGNVTIYPVDPRTLGMVARGSRDTLYQLAGESGGRVITNTNDPSAGLGRILKDASAYYVLGYQPTRAEDDGKYHKIEVRVKRPGMHVLARQGYWAPSGKELATAREEANRPATPVSRALGTFSERVTTRRAADLWVGTSPGENGLTRVAVTWDPSDAPAGRMRAPAVVDVEVTDGRTGSVVEPARSLPRADANAGKREAAVFSLKPGPAALRLTARSEDQGVIDRWVLPLEVPALQPGTLSLSTPRVYRARSLTELRALNAAPDVPPGAATRFARSDRVVVAVDWQAPAGAKPEILGHLLARDGRELAPLTLPESPGPTVRFELPISSLGQGTYVLRLRARLESAAAEQHVVFTIGG
jgi:VWFA-related protein